MFQISIPKDELLKKQFLGWLILAITALAFSGLYSFLPYALRTPTISSYLNMNHLFNVSLMIHVNLGVLVWFLSIISMLMTSMISLRYAFITKIANYTAYIGSFFIIVSPFIGDGEPFKNNYIPIYHNFIFIIGLALFLTAILIMSLITLMSFKNLNKNYLNIQIFVSALFVIIAAICFVEAAFGLESTYQNTAPDILEYFELIFWGAGHVLQFAYVQIVMIVWITILDKINKLEDKHYEFLFHLQILNCALVIPCAFVSFIHPVDSTSYYEFFTLHMKHSGGIIVSIIGLWAVFRLFKNKTRFKNTLEITIFITSVFLFLTGGIIGYLISGANVTVPAHYHGVILGITVSAMGMFYILLPNIGFAKINNKAAIWQLIIYTLGQFIHIVALAISGGYGVLRKDPGSELSLNAKMFMAAMGIGGTIALIGGVLFVILVFKSIRKN